MSSRASGSPNGGRPKVSEPWPSRFGWSVVGVAGMPTVNTWDLNTKKRQTLTEAGQEVRRLAFLKSPHLAEQLSVQDSRVVAPQYPDRLTHCGTFYGLRDRSAFTADGQTLASGSEGRTVKLWDAVTGQGRRRWRTYVITSAWRVQRRYDLLVTAARDGARKCGATTIAGQMPISGCAPAQRPALRRHRNGILLPVAASRAGIVISQAGRARRQWLGQPQRCVAAFQVFSGKQQFAAVFAVGHSIHGVQIRRAHRVHRLTYQAGDSVGVQRPGEVSATRIGRRQAYRGKSKRRARIRRDPTAPLSWPPSQQNSSTSRRSTQSPGSLRPKPGQPAERCQVSRRRFSA